jgi:hypothetical protein
MIARCRGEIAVSAGGRGVRRATSKLVTPDFGRHSDALRRLAGDLGASATAVEQPRDHGEGAREWRVSRLESPPTHD